ncbi:hypothetical protein TNCV_1614831 [Trichonephila clavipes]|nr:hypothetical protein TNCV_1614831 [Trichonephila clavipes]
MATILFLAAMEPAKVRLIFALASHPGHLVCQCAITICDEPQVYGVSQQPHNLQKLQQNISDDIAAISAVQLRATFHRSLLTSSHWV